MEKKPLELNEKLRQIREAKKMTQKEIADVPPSAVKRAAVNAPAEISIFSQEKWRL